MPATLTYPGVYIEEISSDVHTITGVATSIAAFVDYFPAGPMDKAVRILNLASFNKQFGSNDPSGLDADSEASYGVQQFFLNGGSEAYVVRIGSASASNGPGAASYNLLDASGNTLLVAKAQSGGTWGNGVLLEIDNGTADPTTQFNLKVIETVKANGATSVASSESFSNLVMDAKSPFYAVDVVNAGSKLVQLSLPVASTTGTSGTPATGTGGTPATGTGGTPATGTGGTPATGTGGTPATGTGGAPASTVASVPVSNGTVSSGTPALGTLKDLKWTVQLNQGDVYPVEPLPAAPATYLALANALQAQIRAVSIANPNSHLANVTVSVVSSGSASHLVINPGTGNADDIITLGDDGTGLAKALGFTAGQKAQYKLAGGTKGTWDPKGDPDGITKAIIGDPNAKTGLHALDDVDLFNILCLPVTVNLPDTSAFAVATAAEKLCADRRAFYILDIPQVDGSRDTLDGVMDWMGKNNTLRSRNAAVYFPRVHIPDPLKGYRLRATAPSGTVAGLFATTDNNRGVWKAPAGTEAALAGVQKLAYTLTNAEHGVLNPLATNCLRTFPVYGTVCFGARTLKGADQNADEYKYVPVRRLALYVEESLYRGTQWVVFEPNDAPLWAQIRLNVGTFMQGLFRLGAFAGKSPKDAYFVKCDSETTPPDQVQLGIVNIKVGFAPLEPAEFVVLSLQLMSDLPAVG